MTEPIMTAPIMTDYAVQELTPAEDGEIEHKQRETLDLSPAQGMVGLSEEQTLRAELAGLSLSELRTRAKIEGVLNVRLSTMRETLIEMILNSTRQSAEAQVTQANPRLHQLDVEVSRSIRFIAT